MRERQRSVRAEHSCQVKDFMPYLQDNEKQKGEFNHGKREVPQASHPPPPFHQKPRGNHNSGDGPQHGAYHGACNGVVQFRIVPIVPDSASGRRSVRGRERCQDVDKPKTECQESIRKTNLRSNMKSQIDVVRAKKSEKAIASPMYRRLFV